MARRPNPRQSFNQADARALLAAFARLDRRAQLVLVLVIGVVAAVAAASYFWSTRPRPGPQASGPSATWPQPAPKTGPASGPRGPTPPATGAADHLLLGNPSAATPDPANRNNYLLAKPYFALSYNDTNGTPNWVSWRLTAADLGSAPRRPQFVPDSELPAGFKRVTHQDYTGSGFDRGHLCPHGDRAVDVQTSFATFVMTNIIPQAASVNQKAWNNLEEYARDLVKKQNRRLYVVAGGAGRGGTGLNGFADTIGKGKVVVPALCWKVIVAVPETGGTDDPAAVGPDARVIAVVMPNDNSAVGDEWARFRVAPAEIERRTGYRLFDRLAPATADALRARVDDVPVPPPEPKQRWREKE
ncbi:MAG: endonuclease [Phycisphaerales bacterium]|nr:endonuclease [Phycisphaerales bacterium]